MESQTALVGIWMVTDSICPHITIMLLSLTLEKDFSLNSKPGAEVSKAVWHNLQPHSGNSYDKVQILDGTACISLYANALGKGMNWWVLPSAMAIK